MKSLKILLCLVGLLSVHAYADVECGKIVTAPFGYLQLKKNGIDDIYIYLKEQNAQLRELKLSLLDLARKFGPEVCLENIIVEDASYSTREIVNFDSLKIIK